MTSDNGVVYQENVFIIELNINWVQLLFYCTLSETLPRHYEGSPDVPVFHKSFSVLHTQLECNLHRGCSACIWNGDHHINV